MKSTKDKEYEAPDYRQTQIHIGNLKLHNAVNQLHTFGASDELSK